MSMEPKNIAIIGCSGAIGNALTECISDKYPNASLHKFSRTNGYYIDYTNELSIAEAADTTRKDGALDLVIVANGMLHDDEIVPEKSLKDVSAEKFQRLFEINTITPALIAKHFLPKLNSKSVARFAALSARIGSISDNRLGGWYAYRASKAALNMIIKNAAIEIDRSNKQAIVVGLHPGTVDSNLSKPFQSHVPEGNLFTPNYSAKKLMEVLESLTPQESGKCFAWDGQEIGP